MQKIFNNILLPVSLDGHCNPVIEEAVEFSNHLRANLHLILTSESTLSFLKNAFHDREEYEMELKSTLKQLHDNTSHKMIKGLTLFTSYGIGDIHKLISDYAFDHNIDLICLSYKKNPIAIFSNELNASSLAERSNCPVLSLKAFPFEFGNKNIVLPIGQSLPVNKLRVVSYLGRNFSSTIHLVACKAPGKTPEEFTYLGKAYRVLKDYTNLPVVCTSFEGKNLNEMALEYAKKINAGLIVLNPDPKPFLQGFWSRLLSGFNVNNPRIPVLTVS